MQAKERFFYIFFEKNSTNACQFKKKTVPLQHENQKTRTDMHFYKNGNYVVCIEDDGSKTRRCDDAILMPYFPESIDVNITQKCSIGCPYCYSNCTPNGRHADLMSYKFLDTLHKYTEIAFNGNDLDHPQLMEFLYKLQERGIFANMTVSQKQFMDNLDKIHGLAHKRLIYGLGVSFKEYDIDFLREFMKFNNGVLHVINGIINTTDLYLLSGLGLKLLILGYKDVGRGVKYNEDNQDNVYVYKNCLFLLLNRILKQGMFKAVAFDNLAVEQLCVKRFIPVDEWDKFYMGNDGEFTFYIDMVEGTFAKNSMEQDKKYPIGDKTVDEMFDIIRKEL